MGGETADWGYGRAVLRRPEARNSDIELGHVITDQQQSERLATTVIESVTRRSRLSEEQMAKEREELAELARRYFTSRGPATLHDFAWWSGLRITDASAGLEMAKRRLTQETANGQTYWLASSMPDTNDPSPAAYLLPAFDEYTIAYKNRSAVLDPAYTKLPNYGHGIFNPTIVIDGQVVGTWKRALKKGSLTITPSSFAILKRAETRAISKAASRYAKFLGASVVLL